MHGLIDGRLFDECINGWIDESLLCAWIDGWICEWLSMDEGVGAMSDYYVHELIDG